MEVSLEVITISSEAALLILETTLATNMTHGMEVRLMKRTFIMTMSSENLSFKK